LIKSVIINIRKYVFINIIIIYKLSAKCRSINEHYRIIGIFSSILGLFLIIVKKASFFVFLEEEAVLGVKNE